MTVNALQSIEQIESALGADARRFRANSKLATLESASPTTDVPRDGNVDVTWTQRSDDLDAGIGNSGPRWRTASSSASRGEGMPPKR